MLRCVRPCCERAAACFQAAFEKESDWPVPALHSLCLNLRRAAAAADAALVAKGERAARQQEAARTMQKFFERSLGDRDYHLFEAVHLGLGLPLISSPVPVLSLNTKS